MAYNNSYMAPMWRTQKGYYIKVGNMTDEHIKNTMKMLAKHNDPWHNEWYEIFRKELKNREKAASEANGIKLSFDEDLSKPHLVLSLSRMPKNCNECPLQAEYVDDEPMWGDGVSYYCPYGGEIWGSAVQRPKGCPLQPGNKDGLND